MSGTTTINQSGTLLSLYLDANVVIERDANSPPGPVVLSFSDAAINAIALSTFTVQDSATLQLDAAINASVGDLFVIGQNGTLELGTNVSIGVLNDISFASGATGGFLVFDQGVNVDLLAGVSGFGAGDSIDFTGIGAPASPTSYTDLFNGTDTNFTISMTGGGTETFALAGNLTGDPFSMTSDGGTGLLFADTACFAPGTRILTEAGEIAVETLAIGDVAILADGGTAPITFIGTRRFDLRRHPRPETVRPVRIAAGALADGIPSRDLILSPDHALLLDGVLVQAKDLIDGIAITQDSSRASIRYYHVELPRHAILIAEGTPAESYLDTGHRGLFENAGEPLILHPDLMQLRREAESVAPLCTNGPHLAAIRTRLHDRKRQAGFTIAETASLLARAGATLLTPVATAPNEVSFHLPPGATELSIETPVFVPAEFDPAATDRRRLGIALAAILADGTPLPHHMIDPATLHEKSPADPHTWTKNQLRLTLPPNTKTLTLKLAAYPKQWRPRAETFAIRQAAMR
jgi:hypothetical protein